MRIYKYWLQDGVEGIHFDDRSTARWLRHNEGRPLANDWDEVEVERVRELGPDINVIEQAPPGHAALEPQQMHPADFLGSYPIVITDRAADCLRPIIDGYAELLPLTCEGKRLWLVNIRHVSGGVNVERSTVRRFPSTGRLMAIDRYVFDPDRFDGAPIFRLERPAWPTVRDRRVRGPGLRMWTHRPCAAAWSGPTAT